MLEGFLSPNFFDAILRATTPILFATLASTISSKAGITNMALEGMMLFSALFGVIFTSMTGGFFTGMLLTAVAGGIIGLVLAFFILRLKTDEILAAIAINLVATGGTVLLMLAVSGDRGS
ncbi:MAG: ABC transporter permease, partial [Clostridium sp.]